MKYAGGDTRDIWECKIAIREKDNLPNDDNTTGEDAIDLVENGAHRITNNTEQGNSKTIKKKRILYCIGANELTEHKEDLVKAVTERLEIFHQNSEKINATIYLYPSDKQLWRQVDLELSDKLFNMIESEVNSGIKYTEISPMDADTTAEGYDAYYGSSSPLVPAFITQKKPVMLADYSITI